MELFSTEDRQSVAAAESNPQAFRPVFLRYFDPVFRYFVLRGASAVEAERMAMDVFAEALATLPHFDEVRRPVLIWLLDIASKRGRPAANRNTPPLPEPSISAAAGELRRLLGNLDAGTAAVLVLRLVAELSFEETAAALQTSPAAVKMALYRAVNKAQRREWAQDEG